MTPRIFRMMQCITSWVLSCIWTATALAASLCLFAGNFIVAWQSFAIQGFENTPLAEVPFLSSWATALGIGAAPMSALYALLLTATTNVTAIVAMKLVFELETLLFDWRRLRRSTDLAAPAQAADVLITAQHVAVKAAVILTLAFFVLEWDAALFRFRYEALLSGLVDPDEAINWLPDPVVRLGLPLANLVGHAAWGYVACILAAGFATEYAFERARERWGRAGRAIDEALNPPPEPVAVAAPTEAPAMQQPVEPARDDADAGAERTAGQSRTATAQVGHAASMPATEPVTTPPPRPMDNVPLRDRVPRDTVDVIVGPGISDVFDRRDVEADLTRFVRDGAGRYWFLRSYYENEILGNAPVGEEAEAHANG